MTIAGSAKTLSILHVIAPAAFGGMESVVATLARGHARRGHSVRVVSVLSPGDQSHPFVSALAHNDVVSVSLHVGNRDYRAERRAVRAICRDHRPDIVHTHGFRPDVVDGGVARGERIPVVSTCHGFIEFGFRGVLYQWLQRRTLKRYDAVIAVSVDIQTKLLRAGVPSDKIHLVVNAFEPTGPSMSRDAARQILDLPNGPVIGWVGRLSAEKGADIALAAFALLRHPDTRLVMLGEGRELSSLRDRATALGIADRVLWRGAIPNVGRLFPAFDAFLLSSRTEGTPMVLLEAMAARVPIVATRVGGVPDVVDSGAAWLVESLEPNDIARALDELLGRPDLAGARAHHASKRLHDRFAINPWLSRYESIYRDLASRSRR